MINYIRKKKMLYILNSKHFGDLPKYFECDMFYNLDKKDLSFEINNQNVGFMIYIIMELKKNKYNLTYNVFSSASFFVPNNYTSIKHLDKSLNDFISICNKHNYKEINMLKNFMKEKSYLDFYNSLKNMNEEQIKQMSLIDIGL